MILSRRTLAVAISFAVIIAVISGCRTSQQEARRAAVRGPGAATPELSHEVDSLLMIQEKLVEVIDSMTSLVSADHERIRMLERELQSLQVQTDGTPLPPAGDPPSAYSAPPPPMTGPATHQERYNEALALFNSRNYGEALLAFQSLEREDPTSAFAPNYRYWEGECYYGEGEYNQALQTFTRVQDEFPHSAKVAAAGFKIGECYERLGLPQSARRAYERLIADYPNTEFRSRAEARLRVLR